MTLQYVMWYRLAPGGQRRARSLPSASPRQRGRRLRASSDRTNACGPIATAGPGLDYCNAGPHELLAVSSIRRDEIGSAGEEMVLRGDWLIRWTRNPVNSNINSNNYRRSVCSNDPCVPTTLTVVHWPTGHPAGPAP